MRVYRVYVAEQLKPGAELGLSPEASHHLVRVLRCQNGQELELFNGNGSNFQARLVAASGGQAKVEVLAEVRMPQQRLRLELVQAISRGERMDYALQKATELGVAAIHLLTSARVEVKLTEQRLQKRLQHWQKVLIHASEQSGRSTVPELFAPKPLAQWLSVQETGVRRLVLQPDAPRALLESVTADDLRIQLLVGPEGGWKAAELETMLQHAVAAVRFGPRVLRTETAGPAVLAALQARFGDCC